MGGHQPTIDFYRHPIGMKSLPFPGISLEACLDYNGLHRVTRRGVKRQVFWPSGRLGLAVTSTMG